MSKARTDKQRETGIRSKIVEQRETGIRSRTLKTIPSFDELVKGKEKITVASYDVGRVAFAWSLEEWNVEFLKEQRRLFFSTKYKKDRKKGTPMYEQVKKAICLGGKIVDLDVYDISSEESKLDVETRENLFRLLEEKKNLWDEADLFPIEQQFCASFGKNKGKDMGANMEAIKLSECLMSWILIKYDGDKCVFFVPTASKTSFLDAPKMPVKKDRKEWTLRQAKNWAKEKGDEENLKKLEETKLVYDMADAVCQGKATVFKYVVTAE